MDHEAQAAAARLRKAIQKVLGDEACQTLFARKRADMSPTARGSLRSRKDTALRQQGNEFAIIAESLLNSYIEVRQWFFQSLEYLRWLEGRAWYIYCYEDPGCGKVRIRHAVMMYKANWSASRPSRQL